MNADYIKRALCFHGQPMERIWNDERGVDDLHRCGVPANPDYSMFNERQKHFKFQDRAKRLKLHQFFARKANDLYDKDLATYAGVMEDEKWKNSKEFLTVMPPFEVFVNKNHDKIKHWRCVLEGIAPGDVVYGVVTKPCPTATSPAMMIQPLCTAEPLVRYLKDIPIKAYIPFANIGKLPLEKNGRKRSYAINDIVCCEVLEISVDAERLRLGMEGILVKNKRLQLGLARHEDLPAYSCKSEGLTQKYEECLQASKEFLNPNYDILYEINGLNVNDAFSMMNCLRNPFPREDYATSLRQTQASKWAFRSVAEGIDQFKNGNHVEAFQCLNKALNIDPHNVEGLVARGALYANKGSFLKAIEDFDKALKLNALHVNARKYMGETLVALGRSYEEENRIKDAMKAYSDCLSVIPHHEQASLLLETLHQRPGGHFYDNFTNISGTSETNKVKKKGRATSGSSSSGESSSDNSDSKSDLSGSDLHPSPTMFHNAIMPPNAGAGGQYNLPFYATGYNNEQSSLKFANEFKLDDDDTETRVRKLLEEASKHKKEKTKKSKKKKSKKEKKSTRVAAPTTTSETAQLPEFYTSTTTSFSSVSGLLRTNINNHAQTLPAMKNRDRSETPPPKPPSMQLGNPCPPSSSTANAASVNMVEESLPTKFSFQIKRPVKVDKFGLVRLATPVMKKSPTISRSRSRSKSRSNAYNARSNSRGRSRRSRRSNSSGSSFDRRYRRRRSTRSRSGSWQRRRRSREARGRNIKRRRSPSPYNSSHFRRRRSTSRDITTFRSRRSRSRSRGGISRRRSNFGNRVWQRGPSRPQTKNNPSTPQKDSDGRWLHDKFINDASIEEIEEIINKAQKERKQEIISRDKDILKKPNKA